MNPMQGVLFNCYESYARGPIQLLSLLFNYYESYAEREFFIDNLLVRIRFIIVMIRWTDLVPWDFECGYEVEQHVRPPQRLH